MALKYERVLALVAAIILLFLARSYYRQTLTGEETPKCLPVLDCSACNTGCPAPVVRHCASCAAIAACPTCPEPLCPSASSAPLPVDTTDCKQCPERPCAGKLADKIKRESKVRLVVALSTIPCKLWSERLYEVIQGIKSQTFQPDAIYLSIAEKGRRDGLPYILPPYLKADKDITILKLKHDLGPVHKLLPVVAYEKDPETRIVTVDDDWQYPNTMIQHMMEWQMEHPDAAMTFTNGYNVTCWLHEIYKCNITKHGRAGLTVMTQQGYDAACTDFRYMYGWDMCAAVADTVARPVHVIQGVGGCIYVRKFFGPEFFNLGKIEEWYQNPCFYNDDIYTSGVLARRGVPRMVMPQRNLPPNPLYADGRTPRKAKQWTNEPFSYKHQKEKDMPLNQTLCSGDLHGDGKFGDYNMGCSLIFNTYFEEERQKPPYYEAPDYFLPVDRKV